MVRQAHQPSSGTLGRDDNVMRTVTGSFLPSVVRMTLVPPTTYHLTPNCKRTFEGVPRRPLGILPFWIWGVWIRNFLASDSDGLHCAIFHGAEQVNALSLDFARSLEDLHSIIHGIGSHATETNSVHVKDIVGAKHRNFHVDFRLDGLARFIATLARIVTTLTGIIVTLILRISSILAFDKVEVVDIEPGTGHIHAEDMLACREIDVSLYIAEIVET